MPTRTIIVTTGLTCCRNGQDAYKPDQKDIIASTTAPYFETSLYVWTNRAYKILYNIYNKIAEDECDGMGTLRLCNFICIIKDSYETGNSFSGEERTSKLDKEQFGKSYTYDGSKPDGFKITVPEDNIPSEEYEIPEKPAEVPEAVYAQIELLQKRMEESSSYEEYMVLKNELKRLMAIYGLENTS